MGRVSQAQAQHNRELVVDAAARLFRERGVEAVSVAEVMAAAGLTHGGFYKQFSSKEALVAEATGRAFDRLGDRLTALDEDRPDDHAGARRALLDHYLSPAHRDDAGDGCPTAALAADVAREPADSPAREPYARGVEAFARWLGEAGDEDLAALSTMVGALMLARATAGTDLSERVLAAARESLREPGPPRRSGR